LKSTEKKFVENSEADLLSLLELTINEIELKLKHLAFAQKVTMLDHPESLCSHFSSRGCECVQSGKHQRKIQG